MDVLAVLDVTHGNHVQGALEIGPRRTLPHLCANRCETTSMGRRFASREAFLLGYPAAFLCEQCAKGWLDRYRELAGVS